MIIISDEAFRSIGNAGLVILAIAAVAACVVWAASKGGKR